MTRRVTLVQALLSTPAVLLADEPTGSLDSSSVETVLDIFRGLQADRGVTIVLVTHDSAVAKAAHRIVEMLDGRIVNDRTEDTSECRDRP
ncbi:MAG TPA: hypothetical protein VEJ87_15065 [Acidimicrobiales bacterium]|nr:hypothetical protein [Acidimicrobiales bacterium]